MTASTAIGLTEFGTPDVLRRIDVEPEPLGPQDIRLHVRYAAVNPTDTLRRSGAQAQGRNKPEPPGVVPGMDVMAEVVEVGDDVATGVQVGDHVIAVVVPDGAHGAYREDLVVPARSAVAVPAGVSDAEASTLPMNALTARMALDFLNLERGRTIAITGAAGALGGYVIQLAKADGLTVVADAAKKDEALIKGLGADIVVPRGDDVAQAIRQQLPDGVDGLVDGSVQLDALLPAVRDGGRMATVRGWDGGDQDRVEVEPVWVMQYATEWEKLDRLRQQVEDGQVTLRVAEEFAADDAAEAHRRLEAGGVRGRLVLRF